ncbi:MAG: [FeFe] hydrogenase H-cluster radical SAM maturase HydE, partial [Oscillospiraceae bacterium]|nr:[FeFe] hydrogenase H-cluster radical SAM maturase HydE [Oscillospiraceae bacterium]
MTMNNIERIDSLEANTVLPRGEMRVLLESCSAAEEEYLYSRARFVREREFGKSVWLRGLIEISSYCKNDCYYCGLRRGNRRAERYRLGETE